MKMRVLLADVTGIDLPILDELAQKGGMVSYPVYSILSSLNLTIFVNTF